MEMASAYESLAAEIDRVVTSPYPTQLKVSFRSHAKHNIDVLIETTEPARSATRRLRRLKYCKMGTCKAMPDRAAG